MLACLKVNTYQLAIIDLQLEDGDSLHLISIIRKLYPTLKILVFSGNSEELYAQRLYHEGVMGYLNKKVDDSEIITAIRTIMSDKNYVSERLKNILINTKNVDLPKNPFDLLTQREIEVVSLMLKGKRPYEICLELNLQPPTVATYKTKIYSKLKITNVLELKDLVDEYHEKNSMY